MKINDILIEMIKKIMKILFFLKKKLNYFNIDIKIFSI